MAFLTAPSAASDARPPSLGHRGKGRVLYFIFSCWLLLCWLAPGVARSQAASHEYPLKAVFLLNFAQFTEWPTNNFAGPDDPFVIGVLGRDPFGAVLDETMRTENKAGHKFVVQRLLRLEDATNCHMLFISQSEARRVDAIVAAVKGHPILTVSEIENSAYQGVTVRFITENNKIRLRINTNSLAATGLSMSSKLLRVAELVPDRKR